MSPIHSAAGRPAIEPAMTLIFVNRYFYPDHSATSQVLTDIAFGLAAKGYRVRVVTSRQRYSDRSAQLPSRERVRGVEVHRVWTTRFGRSGLPGRAVDYAGVPSRVGLDAVAAGARRRRDHRQDGSTHAVRHRRADCATARGEAR